MRFAAAGSSFTRATSEARRFSIGSRRSRRFSRCAATTTPASGPSIFRFVRPLRAAGKTITVVHDIGDLDSSSRSRSDVVVSGHSHKPGYRLENGVLFFNPGSAGPRRFQLPISVGALSLTAGRISPKLVTIAVSGLLQRGKAARRRGRKAEG